MLQHTFCHLKGIGPKLERGLWDSGIISWSDVAEAGTGALTLKRRERLKQGIDESAVALQDGNAAYFGTTLASRHQWRMFREFGHSLAYIDIETTGLRYGGDQITTIALYDGKTVRHYIQGQNLDDFLSDIEDYRLIVTYNGKCFDVPFIEQTFGITLDQAHIDLRYVLRALGYSGGLKGCEHDLGIHRGALEEVDGYVAVLLWNDYLDHSNQGALDTLLAYNVQDVLNLEALMTIAYNEHLAATPFLDELRLPEIAAPCNPFSSDRSTLERILHRYQGSAY